jgi:peptide chain release factor 2
VILFDPVQLKAKIDEDETLMNEDHFWNDQRAAKKVVQRLHDARHKYEQYHAIVSGFHELEELVDLLQEDASLYPSFRLELDALKKQTLETRQLLFFSGEFDTLNAIVELHPGAGGTESHDWADMLYRMYVRFAEWQKFSIQVLDFQAGEEAGIKSVTMMIKGMYAYGLLKAEKGVHRLVRISPFDANGRRHTSFASVNVIPDIQEAIDLDIPDKDLRIDTYRSGGAGGQNVNKVESAVRITHLPTGLVASCQIERSQIQNKEMAMNMLKAQLYQRKKQEQQLAMDAIVGEQKDIEWGSQIRSYVFQPYTLVKDHRTNYQEGDVGKVMDGDITGFIQAYLEMEAKKRGS